MIYLASPYAHDEEAFRDLRYHQAADFAGLAMQQGFVIFSPIIYGHTLSKVHNLPQTHEFWMPFCLTIMRKAESVWLLELNGWEESKGVALELALCKTLNISLVHYKPYPDCYRLNNCAGEFSVPLVFSRDF